MSNVSKGFNSVSGGATRQKNVPTFNIPKPKEENPKEIFEEEQIGREIIKDEVKKKESIQTVADEIPISLDVDYFEAFKNYKPKYETHKQITVRIAVSMDDDL